MTPLAHLVLVILANVPNAHAVPTADLAPEAYMEGPTAGHVAAFDGWNDEDYWIVGQLPDGRVVTIIKGP
jgi:hypothetical protein